MKTRPNAQRFIICLIGTLTALLSLSGCRSISGLAQLPAEKAPVTLRFAVDERFDRSFYEALLPAFAERYPHITIELAPPVRGEAIWNCEGQGTSCLAFRDLDVLAVSPWTISKMAELNMLMDLSTKLENTPGFGADDFHAGVLASFVHEGKTLAVPAAATFYAMFYNPVLFSEAGEPCPNLDWTWSDFLAAAQRLTNRQEGVYGYAAYGGDIVVVPIIYQNRGRIFDDVYAPSRIIFDDPYTIATLDWYAGLIHNHQVAPTEEEAFEVFDGAASMAIALATGVQQGKIAMWPWTLFIPDEGSNTETSLPPQWGVAPLPRNARSATLATVLGYGIPVTSRDPEASWLWIAFLTERVHDRMFPARKSVFASLTDSRDVRPDIILTAQAMMESDVIFSGAVPTALLEPYSAFWSAVQQVMSGEVSAEEALMEAEQHVAVTEP